MDNETLKRLLAQVERPTLDFKGDPYGSGKSANAELTKDIMGIANNLRRDEVGHILIGVDEDPTTKRGKVVGIQPGLDDASVQNAVKDWLVRMPRFSYGELQHDGHTVGSVEIRGEGRRPYYPVRASGSALAVNIARVRTGSSTTEACPHDIHRVVEAGQRCASRKASPRAEVAESGSAAVARIDVEAIGASHQMEPERTWN